MASKSKCAVLSCHCDGDLQLFRVPAAPFRRNMWLNAAAESGGIEQTKHPRLCENHFTEDQFVLSANGKRSLKKNACPTIFSKAAVQSERKRLATQVDGHETVPKLPKKDMDDVIVDLTSLSGNEQIAPVAMAHNEAIVLRAEARLVIAATKWLDEDVMDAFCDLVALKTEFRIQRVGNGRELMRGNITAIPQGQRHLQILHCGDHWVTVYYTGLVINFYDSMANDAHFKHEDVTSYIYLLFPYGPEIRRIAVQQQTNCRDCGVYAIANAVSIILQRDPATQRYNQALMRPHLLTIFDKNLLTPFPVVNDAQLAGRNATPRNATKKTNSVLFQVQENRITECSAHSTRIEPNKPPAQQSRNEQVPPAATAHNAALPIVLRAEARKAIAVASEWLTEDVMDAFCNLVALRTTFRMQQTGNSRELLRGNISAIPQGQPHVQILYCGHHWVTVYYTGQLINFYDSKVNDAHFNHEDVTTYINLLFPYRPEIRRIAVQQQTNGSDCGVYAIANAVSIMLQRDPATQRYNQALMRRHLLTIFEKNLLTPFPVVNDAQLAGRNATKRNVVSSKTNCALLQVQENIIAECSNVSAHNSNIEQNKAQLPRNTKGTYLVAAKDNVMPDEQHLGAMNFTCENCSALHFRDELSADKKFTLCCRKGKVHLERLSQYPELLHSLLTNQHPYAAEFLNNIRNYNSAFAFASLGVNIDIPPGNGPYCFKIHGQIYHKISDINVNSEKPSYGHLYFLDTAEAGQRRATNNPTLTPYLLAEIDNLMREINPYAVAYRFLREVVREQPENVENVTINFFNDRTTDARRYNFPTANEVAVVYRNDVDGAPPANRDLRLYVRNTNTGLKNISYLNPISDAMCYPILFPRGDAGWKVNMSHVIESTRNKVITAEYYGYRLFQRNAEFNPILHAGKLTQQFIVDMYVKTETSRLMYIRTNQRDLRVQHYEGLIDYLQNEAAENHCNVGKMVILPSTFQGSPRCMKQNYQDAMCVVAKFGRPDLFVTFTCNPKWKEIAGSANEWNKAEHRPDLVSRVFHLKLKSLLTDIKKNHVFGIPLAVIYVIEYQKRGLPHAHILIFLSEKDKIQTAELVDALVSAEFPDPTANPRLFELVSSHMIHGPCGPELNKNSICMKDGECGKKFPKPIADETVFCENGYPTYRRRQLKEKVNIRGLPVDNTFVVPHNRWLLQKYNAHINVEICSSIKSVKYICKYFHKGYDCTTLQIEGENNQNLNYDEIQKYQDSRYVSAPEAAWRLFQFPMHENTHTIIRLPVHLPNRQNVYFKPGNEEIAAENAVTRRSMLTAWFVLNQTDAEANQYTYLEIPIHYTFKPNVRVGPDNAVTDEWRPRKRRAELTLARIYTISMKNIELYCLRLLLLNVRGARTFEHLRTVSGTECASFKEAAKALNLFKNDREPYRCLDEAIAFQMPRELRTLFAMICLYCEVIDATDLWQKYKPHLTEDYRRQFDEAEAESRALSDIQSVLLANGSNCTEYGLPAPSQRVLITDEFVVEEEYERGLHNSALLNEEQTAAFNAIMGAIDDDTPEKLFFVNGCAGSGKTFLYNTLISVIRGASNHTIAVAWTGIASTLLLGGRTVHSQFKLPFDLNDTSVSEIRPQSMEALRLRHAKLIVWDEITMAPVHALHTVDRLLRDITNIDRPFGDKVIVVGGDFRQCLPVVPKGKKADVLDVYVKNSNLWRLFQVFNLTTNVRANADETEFSEWLLKLGNGHLNVNEGISQADSVVIPLPDRVMVENVATSVYGDNFSKDDRSLQDKAILSPKNDDCFLLNDIVLNKLAGQAKSYYSADRVVSDNENDAADYTAEFLHSLTPSGMPRHLLKLKVGAIVLLLRNMNVRTGLCNGTRLTVKVLKNNVILAQICSGRFKGNDVLIPRITLTSNDATLPVTLERRQFPVRLSFAMTINKSQGQTLEKIGIFLPRPVFGHGQLYVAFSRVKAFSAVSVQVNDTRQQGKRDEGTCTTNIVYKDVL